MCRNTQQCWVHREHAGIELDQGSWEFPQGDRSRGDRVAWGKPRTLQAAAPS